MEKLKPTNGPAWEIYSNRILNRSAPEEPIKEFFSDLICDDFGSEKLKASLIELEQLVEGRTRQYVKTIDLLSQEIAQRKQAERLLHGREAILKAVSSAAEQIILKDDWQEAIPDILCQLGQAAAVSRVYVFQNQTTPQGELVTSQLFEWTAPDIEPQIHNPELKNFSYARNGFDQWQKSLEQGKPIFGGVKKFPTPIQRVLSAQKIQSIAIVPIRYKGKSWGFIGFDHCRNNHKWSRFEIDALKTAASIIGGGIQRQQLEKVLRKSRARYRAVVDSQKEMICRYKDDGTISFVNDAYCRYFGKDRECLIGDKFFLFCHEEERNKINHLVSSLTPDKPMGTLEHELVLSSKEVCWHKWTYRKIFDDPKDATEFQAVGWDISDAKRAENLLHKVLENQEEEIATRTAELQGIYEGMVQREKMAALGILISGIAHEINNPNNFISFNIPILENYLQELTSVIEQLVPNCESLDFLGMTYPDFKKDTFRLLNNLEHGSDRINNTVSRLKTFAQPHNTNEMRLTNLKSLLERSIELCQGKIRKCVRLLELNVPKLFPKIYTNPHLLEQVIINLLINASQSADKKDSFIKITASEETEPRNHFSIHVEDNGCGMDDKTKNTIFTPFFTTKEKEGTGLGLYVSQSFIRGMGGYITVESALGKGSCFRIILPQKES